MMHLQANLMRQCPSLLYHLSSFHTPCISCILFPHSAAVELGEDSENCLWKWVDKGERKTQVFWDIAPPFEQIFSYTLHVAVQWGLDPLSLCLYRGFNSGLVGMGKMFSNHPFVQTRGVPAIGWDGERCFQTVHLFDRCDSHATEPFLTRHFWLKNSFLIKKLTFDVTFNSILVKK
jgi:hypothetical protein